MKIDIGGIKTNFPDFLIIGTARSGTSSLFYYLNEHREIFMPSEKEPHFFNFPEKWSIETYARLFSNAGENQKIGEATASYLYYYQETIATIRRLYGAQAPELKVIVILRNPIERAWSYFMLLKRGGRDIEFFEFVKQNEQKRPERPYHDFIESGRYCAQLKAFRDQFPNIHLLLFEQLTGQTEKALKSIYRYLDLQDTAFTPSNVRSIYNRTGQPKNAFARSIHDFLFQAHPLKSRFKHVLPLHFRQQIKNLLSPRIMKKQTMPEHIRNYLFSVYQDEIRLLSEMVDPEAQKKIVLSWIGER